MVKSLISMEHIQVKQLLY